MDMLDDDRLTLGPTTPDLISFFPIRDSESMAACRDDVATFDWRLARGVCQYLFGVQ